MTLLRDVTLSDGTRADVRLTDGAVAEVAPGGGLVPLPGQRHGRCRASGRERYQQERGCRECGVPPTPTGEPFAPPRLPGADRLVALGVLSAIPTAAAGLNDWATLEGQDRRLGLVHGTTNVVATGLFGASWLARKTGHRFFGRTLALAGYGTVSIGAFLGGHLSFRRGVGVDHTAFLEAPEEWTPVADEASVKEAEPLLVKTADVEIVLVREGGSLYALLERCAHQGGPLHEGRIEGGCVVCPWHSSRYRLSDGAALSGPTAHPQPALEVRVRDGKVEVRRMASGDAATAGSAAD